MSRELPSLGHRKEGRKLRAVGVKKTKARPSAHLTAHMLLQRDTLVESPYPEHQYFTFPPFVASFDLTTLQGQRNWYY